MKIAVMGAGAVGCYFGGMLARAGHHVTLVARAEHVAAIARRGLLMETVNFREAVPVHATSGLDAMDNAELVLFSVKSIDTEVAGASIARHLAPGCTVLSLQNGVDNADRLRAVLAAPVLAAVVRVAAEMASAGHVRQRGGGQLILADDEAGSRIAQVLRCDGIEVRLSPNLVGEQWTKLAVNCALNALCAIAQQPFGPLLQAQGVVPLMREVVAECMAVALAQGIRVVGDPWEALQRSASQVGQQASMAQDVAKGRRTEIDHLNGYVARLGQAQGVPTPVNGCLQVVIRLLEARKAP